MGQTSVLVEKVLQEKFGVNMDKARWGTEGNQWLFLLHRVWMKLDLTGEGVGDMMVLTSPLGTPPTRNVPRFHSMLLARNFHLPGPSLWSEGGLFGLREVRYIDGLQDMEVVDMAELMAEVALEVTAEVTPFRADGLQLFSESDERAIHRIATSLGVGL